MALDRHYVGYETLHQYPGPVGRLVGPESNSKWRMRASANRKREVHARNRP